MKIRKFNESKKELDTEYLNFVFSDFIDNGAEIEMDESADRTKKYWHIFLEEPQLNLRFNSIDDYTNNINEVYKFSKELESCFKKLEDDMINYEIVIEEITDEKGNYIFNQGSEMPYLRYSTSVIKKLQRIIIITFSE
jgi:hypothetical protein